MIELGNIYGGYNIYFQVENAISLLFSTNHKFGENVFYLRNMSLYVDEYGNDEIRKIIIRMNYTFPYITIS